MRPSIVIFSAFVTPLRSGAEACAEEVARSLCDRYDITIVAARMRRDLPAKDVLQGVPVRRLGLGVPFDKWLYPFLAALHAARVRPQIVHAVLESYAGAALILCAWVAPASKRMLTCQSTNTTTMLRPMHQAAHTVTAISTVLVKRAKRFGKNAHLIPNGLRLRDIPTLEKVPGRVLFVGRLEPMKGVDTLIQAYSKMVPLILEKTSLHIVGDGSERVRLEHLAKDLGIGNRVKFLGYIASPAVYKQFAEAELFCGLSRSEALGNVFLEAQAARCAVIATNVGGIPDIVKDRSTGLLVPPDSVAATKDALEKCLIDKGFAMKIASAGKFHAQDFDWGSIAERYGELYEELLAKK